MEGLVMTKPPRRQHSWYKMDSNGRSPALDAITSPDPWVVARELKRRIRGKFGQQHAVLFEVPVEGRDRLRFPGGEVHEWKVTRRIDAVAVGLYERTDFLVHGFEIKTNREDLMSEICDDQIKSEGARRVCDRWWLVVPNMSLFLCGAKCPPGWGLLVAARNGLRVEIEPEPLKGERDTRFVASLIGSAYRQGMKLGRDCAQQDQLAKRAGDPAA